ncbi:MAG: hypothetical protein FJ271_03715 [Planctomycetes bacterium]|nr:hypothetical protein [Planctomycetota bacterium]
MRCLLIMVGAGCLFISSRACAEPPAASYIFPAGGQRGTAVPIKVGGLFLHSRCGFEMLGPGVSSTSRLQRTETLWFEGPMLTLPDSQRQEDYPKDMAGHVKIAADAPLGPRHWRVWTSQGATPAMKFLVGDLPEIVEKEIDGDPLPTQIALPVTVNGRIFPREDVDVWTFAARKGQSIICRVDAGRLGSPLEPRLEVRDPQGRRLVESDDRHAADPHLRFLAPVDGTYQVHIHDARFQGGQAYVYRLTITADPYIERHYPLGGKRGSTLALQVEGQALPTSEIRIQIPATAAPEYAHQATIAGKRLNPVLLDVDDLPEYMANDAPLSFPAVCNGWIDKPGKIDAWTWTGRKGETWLFELRANRLGSALDGVLTIHDDKGKQLAKAEATAAQPDPVLQFTAPVDATYQVRIQDRFGSRGGPDLAFRLRVVRPPQGDFRLTLASDAVTIPRKGKGAIKLTAERLGGFKEAIDVTVHGLPAGMTAAPAKLGPGQNAVDIALQAGPTASIAVAHLKIEGSAKVGGNVVSRIARVKSVRGVPDLDSMLLAVALPTPFKIKGDYVMGFAPRGTVLKRQYKIERDGYDGPIEIRLTDKQARHLQGAHGPVIVVPAGATAFHYVASLPPWMEIGRTARVCVMGTAIVKEPDGTEHEVSFSSVNQNEQMVAVVGPGQLALDVERSSLGVVPDQDLKLPLRIKRGQGLKGAVRIELIVPSHIRGISAVPVEIAPGQETGTLTIRCRGKVNGALNMPLTVRASIMHEAHAVVAEAAVEVSARP